MVRERVGDWRLAWRFALAGLIAGLLVIALAQTPATGGTFDAAQDRLFPAPGPDPEITLVAIDTATQNNLGIYPFSNANHAQVINYLASLHPKVILFDIVLDHLTGKDLEPPFADTDAPLENAIKAAGNVVLVCTLDDQPQGQFSKVAASVGERGLANPDRANAVRGVALRPDAKSTCPQNEADEPAFMQALRVATGINDPLEIKASVATFGDHRIPLVGGQMLINLTRGSGSTCSYVDAYNSNCPHPELITNHIVVVGTKLAVVSPWHDPGRVHPRPLLRGDLSARPARLPLGPPVRADRDRSRGDRIAWRAIRARGARTSQGRKNLRPLHRPSRRAATGSDALRRRADIERRAPRRDGFVHGHPRLHVDVGDHACGRCSRGDPGLSRGHEQADLEVGWAHRQIRR